MNIFNTFKIAFLVFAMSFAAILPAIAGEGMWLPLLLKAFNEEEMQEMGMKMTAEDIYSVNQGSLKDAIVHFGGFCTAEVVSDQGLLLTNHHCGYSEIQSHSSLENNYLRDGFWASNRSEELTNPGLFARFIDRIIDVSDVVLAGTSEAGTDAERQGIIKENIAAYEASVTLGVGEGLQVKPFFNTNQYFAFVTVTYNDVRLVGAPPESIGKFGADTDNWEWPRHTGDFSFFRIYAGPNNAPADYSADNKPYSPKHHLPISLDGVEEGDFTLIFGFPGRTDQYLPSFAVEQTLNVLNPAKIEIRDNALEVVDKAMREDPAIKLKYASKFASIANYWKKWIGESLGLEKTGGINKKKTLESELVKREPGAQSVLDAFETLYSEREESAKVTDYFSEVAGRNVEMLRVAGLAKRLVSAFELGGEEAYTGFAERLKPYLANLYKNYDAGVDQAVFTRLMGLYQANLDSRYVPSALNGDLNRLGSSLYSSSAFTSGDQVMKMLEMSPADAVTAMKKDKGYQFYGEMSEKYQESAALKYGELSEQIDSLQRIYMKMQMDAFPERKFWPDANSTMRVTYGQVNGYAPKDGVWYDPVTHLDGMVAKYVPGDYEFDVAEKLLDLYEAKDYGSYATTEGKIPVCFLGSNHTTGGNSGSPAIDAHGNLIGLNFDRVWEGTMSDINYDKSICRNIMVDARYILFIVDKYAGATHLIDEMDLVHPKAGMIQGVNGVNGVNRSMNDGKAPCCEQTKCCNPSECCPDKKKRLFKRKKKCCETPKS